jgi:hypothetical protein
MDPKTNVSFGRKNEFSTGYKAKQFKDIVKKELTEFVKNKVDNK